MQYQLEIPHTTKDRYISAKLALNLPIGETSGDWHQFIWWSDTKRKAKLFGKKQAFDTTNILGDFGIADRKAEIIEFGLETEYKKVYVADHYRAILDIALYGAYSGRMGEAIGAGREYLDTKEQLNVLLNKAEEIVQSKYLSNEAKNNLSKWIERERKPIYRGEPSEF
jgi:hypothetical protein